MNIQITNDFITELISRLESIGVSTNDIVCILHGGSSLYLDNYSDIDLKVIVKRHNPYAKEEMSFNIQNMKVDCCYHTVNEWNSVLSKDRSYYVCESVDMKKVIGNDTQLKRYDCVKDQEVRKHLIDVYDKHLFGAEADFEEKRLWNFLLFYFKCENNSHRLTQKQLKILQKAHDLKYSKTMFKDYFNKLKGEIL